MNISSYTAAVSRNRPKRKGNEHIVSSTIEKDEKQRTPDDGFATENQDGASRIFVPYALRLPYSLSESWDVRLLPFFLACVRPAHDISIDIFGIVPRVVARANTSSALYHACDAVASNFLARKSRSINAVSKHIREYGTALAKLRTALNDPDDVKSDNTLLAIWFLSLYEVSIDLIYEARVLLILRMEVSSKRKRRHLSFCLVISQQSHQAFGQVERSRAIFATRCEGLVPDDIK